MSFIYPGGDEQVTPNLGLATWGMDEVLAENMILIDAAIGGPTGSIKINGSVVPATNFINSASVTFSVVGSNVSATATSAGSAAWSSLTGTLSNGQVIPYADAGISRLGGDSLAIGNGTAGNFSGNLKLTGINNLGTYTDGAGSVGTSGQVLTSTATATAWVSAASIGTAWSSLTGTLSNGQVIPYADVGISRLGAASLAIGNGTASDTTGKLTLSSIVASNNGYGLGGNAGSTQGLSGSGSSTLIRGSTVTIGNSSGAGVVFLGSRINQAGADFAGQATVTAGNTTQAVTFAANYTGTGQPVIVLTPTSDPLAAGLPVGYWVTYSGGAGAWTGFTISIQTALAGNVTFNYIVVGVA